MKDSGPQAGSPAVTSPDAERFGVLVIDKHAGPTSHDVVLTVKRHLRAKKVGHLGTLDPFATGVLPLAFNKATKLAKHMDAHEKVYEATVQLGRATDRAQTTLERLIDRSYRRGLVLIGVLIVGGLVAAIVYRLISSRIVVIRGNRAS